MPNGPVSHLEQLDAAWSWDVYRPSEQSPWDTVAAAHLFRRAGFGADAQQLRRAVVEGPQATLDRLIDGGPESESFYVEAKRLIQPLLAANNLDSLPAWWLYVMLHSPHPLLEKLTLFWHGHFATSAAKVEDARLMYDQNATLRKHALGRFGPLLTDMARDPAMLLWLDSASNRKLQPNENFAREVMELFSLGLGQYTEQDIKQAARAFTGWEVRQGRFRFQKAHYDSGAKTVLGQTGHWDGDDVLRILLEQPAAGEFLVRKLFRYFVSEAADPPRQLVAPLAAEFLRKDYDLEWLVRTMLGSNLFQSPHARGQKIKAPVEMAIGLLQALDGTTNTYALAQDLADLGQRLFYPPNVKGWDGGSDWINSSTLLARANLVWALVSGTNQRYSNRVALAPLVERTAGGEPAKAVRSLLEMLVAVPVPEQVVVQLTALAANQGDGNQQLRWARVVQAIATMPEFQLA